jgi:hypothetical protein
MILNGLQDFESGDGGDPLRRVVTFHATGVVVAAEVEAGAGVRVLRAGDKEAAAVKGTGLPTGGTVRHGRPDSPLGLLA